MNFHVVGIILCILGSITLLRAHSFERTGQMSDECFDCLCEKFLVNCSKTQPNVTEEYKENCHVCHSKSAIKTHNFQLLLEPSHDGSARKFVVKMVINGMNADGNGTDMKTFELKLPVHPEVALAVRGISVPEVVTYNASEKLTDRKIRESDIGPEVLHVYEIENQGPTTVQQAEVYILWPTYTLEGKSLLYLTSQPEVIGNAECNIIDVNNLNLQIEQRPEINVEDLKQKLHSSDLNFNDKDIEMGSAIFKRKKREEKFPFMSDKIGGQFFSGEEEDAFQEELSCGQSLCKKIHCMITNLEKGDQVIFIISSRLWRETYNEIGESEIITSSKLLARVAALPNGANTHYLPYKEYVVSTQVNLLNLSVRPWWIIVLSICCGILLLGLLTILSWKLGFFTRKRIQDKEPLNDRNGYQIASNDAAL